MSNNTLITYPADFKSENLVFSKAKLNDKRNTYRINTGYRNPDNTVGELLLPVTWEAMSFGVEECRDKDTGELQKYQLSIAMFDQNEPTAEQLQWVEVYEKVVQAHRDHLLEESVKKQIKKPRLTAAHLDDLCKVMWWKRDENGERVQGRGPMLYPKLRTNMNKDYTNGEDDSTKFEIDTIFTDENGNDLDPKDLIGVRGRVRAAIAFEGIWIGGLIRMQVKAAEVEFISQNKKKKRLFCREPPVVVAAPLEVEESEEESGVEEESPGNESEEIVDAPEPVPEPEPAPAKKGGRRLLRK